MKVAFVYPKKGGIFPRMPVNLSITPPLGIMYLASVCRENKIDVNLIDLTFDRSWTAYEKRITEQKPDVVGFTALSPFYDDVLTAVSITKKVVPNAKIIIGGPHATAQPLEVIKNDFVDIVVVGEAEQTIVPLLNALENQSDLKEVKGIVFKKDGQIIQTEKPEYVNLETLPFPAREMLPTAKKYFRQIPLFPSIPPVGFIIASRGCPFNCSFCQPMLREIFGNKVRFRSPQSVLRELDELVEKYHIKSLYFIDDNMTVNKKWLYEICDGIEKRNYGLIIGVQGKADTLTPEMAERLKRINCRYMSFGVESGNQRILDEIMGKHLTIAQIENAFKICEQNNILTCASLMIGSPGDTKETIMDTVKLLERIRPNFIDLHYTAPTPGSKMFNEVEFDDAHDDRWSAGAIKLDGITPEELNDLFFAIQLRYRQVKKRPPFNFMWDYFWGTMRYGYNFLSLSAQYAYFCLDNSVLVYKLLGKWVFSLKGKH
jgi:anaerobic magnesium-protoporphyrin IX monomethyl ester cyclase